jgi:tRNA 2-thiocytidine biosynthesis protein TtcA
MTTAAIEKLEKKLFQKIGKALADFNMIEEGDRILVAVSGGKDSSVLLHSLQAMRDRAPIKFDLVAYHLDQGHPGFPVHIVEEFFRSRGLEWVIDRQDTYSIVKETLEPGKTTCSLCSRLRRGILYNAAPRLGCNKIALGHHRDDGAETLLLNLFFAGRLSAMPPKLLSDDGRNVIIRPLAYCGEQEIADFCQAMGFPTVPCRLCDEQPDLQRRRIGELLDELEKDFPGLRGSILRATSDVRKSQLLDKKIWDFDKLKVAAKDEPRKLPVIS